MQHELECWREEKRSAYLYAVVSSSEKDPVRQQLFSRLAQEADSQADIWAQTLRQQGMQLPSYEPELRTRIVACLIRKLGPQRIKPVLAAIKIRGLSIYSSQRLPSYHAKPTSVDEVGARHQGVGSGGGLRAAVFGANDGLVSTVCLVMGVAGAAVSYSTILLTGVAGLLAGAFSMAAGEYVSMRSQREMFEYQIGLERAELARYPEEEAEELALIYIARGMHEDEAKTLAKRMISDPEMGLDTLAREELGLNPDELGSPWMAAISSFLAFSVGGVVPLLPYLLGVEQYALKLSIVLTALALFGVGAALSLFTGRNAWGGGLRMLLIGSSAGAMTYFIGSLLGTSLA
ncbi:MAG TPA: VIT1/CCC1 transporter family protein [Methylophilaceae bacterium]|nr:VIT1/CCC1 transporter family protein [Methylophilaceae bacterium]